MRLFSKILAAAVLLALPGAGFAQTPAAPAAPASPPPARFETQVRAAGSTVLMAGQTPIELWAVEPVANMGASFDLKARTALDNAVGGAKITCEVKDRDARRISAQCVNKEDKDLGLFMLQQGFATVDRSAVFGTVFEDAYIQAETQAQGRALGVWAQEGRASGESGSGEGTTMISFGFVLFICILGAFAVLSVVIMRGFQNVIDAQNQNAEMVAHERKLRDKERGIVAVMLDSELKANKSKIEAYRVVYEEMLRALKDPEKAPKYKKAGDIIQKQPALSRSVFDRNTDKLDMLGERLSSQVIHFYARVKSTPDYINLEPNTPLEEAIAMIEKVLGNANRLNQIMDKILENFANSGISSQGDDF